MRIWFVPALGAVMVIAAVVASRMSPAAAAPAPRVWTEHPVPVALPHYAEPPPPPPAQPSLTGIPACDLYVAKVQELEACDKFPASARDAMGQSMQSFVSGIRGAAAGARDAAAQACSQASDAIAQARTSLGC